MPSSPIVLFDACVLYPAPLRDLLMHLSLSGLFRAKWTNEIHEEWISNLLKQRPDLKRMQLERTRDLMNAHVLDALIENYERWVTKLSLPDPHDRHVLAAAIKAKSSLIITFNLKDFPAKALELYDIKALHPDDFLTETFMKDPAKIHMIAERLRKNLKNPPMSRTEYFHVLEQQHLPKFVSAISTLGQ